MAKVIIFGVQDFAQLAHFYLTHDSEHDVTSFTVDKEYMKAEEFLGLPVVEFETLEHTCPPGDYKLFVPMSPAEMNKSRANKYYEAKNKGYQFITYISSKATYYNTPVGENCFIFENNVIQPFTEIGNNVMMWSGNHLGHHSVIKDHCFIASHVVISGHCVIDEYSFLGVNATVRDRITVSKRSLIGAGALILENTKESGVYPGIKTQLSKIASHRVKGL